MKTAIIIPGMPSKEEYFDPDQKAPSNMHWFSWIQRELLLEEILAQAIELPAPYEPNYEDWKKVFDQFEVNKDTHLIGHSCGAGFLVRWLSENDIKVGKVALVAPWLDPSGELSEDNHFFDFEIDENLGSKTDKLAIFFSSDDYEFIKESVDRIVGRVVGKVELFSFSDKGHFVMGDMNTEEFPELKKFLLED